MPTEPTGPVAMELELVVQPLTPERLADLERRVSAQRKAVFAVIDTLQDELASRYEQTGAG